MCAGHAHGDDRDLVALRDERGAGVQAPDRAVASASAFRVDQQVPAVCDELLDVLQRVRAAAGA